MSGTASTMNVGKDFQGVLVGPTGVIPTPKITSFHGEPQYETAKSKVLDGPTRQFSLPDGHKLTIKFDREDPGLDNFFTAVEAAYFATGGFVPLFTFYGYITERNGSTTTQEWAELDLQYKPGEWKSGGPVSGSIDGFARYWRSI